MQYMSVILCSICIFSFYFENLNWKIFSCCYLDVCLIFSCLRYLVFWVLPSELDINVASLKWQLSFPEEQVIRLFNPGDIYSRSNKTLCSFSWTRYFPSFIGPSYWWNWKEETFFFYEIVDWILASGDVCQEKTIVVNCLHETPKVPFARFNAFIETENFSFQKLVI